MPPANPANRKLSRDAYFLDVRQEPEHAKSMGAKPADRKPVDPPPIVRLRIKDHTDPSQNYLQSPYYMCIAMLWDPTDERPAKASGDGALMAGTLVSSLHKLKDVNNEDGGFFVFGDLSVKPEGEFRLRFVLYELLDGEVANLAYITSKPFTVHPAKSFPGLSESSFISRSFGDQGVRLRIRKDGRGGSKRNAKSQNIGEEGYETKSQTNTTPTSQQSNIYPEGSGYPARTFPGAEHGLVKRQRTSNDFGQNSFDRDHWSAPNSAGLYPSTSNFSQEVVPQSHSIGFATYRGQSAQSHLGQSVGSIYSRGQGADYNNHHQIGYGAYGANDPSTGLSQYSDTSAYSGSHNADPSSDLPTPAHHSPTTYSTLGDSGMRQQNLSMRLAGQPQGPAVLPSPYSLNALSSPSGNAIPANYSYSPQENRYGSQAGAQSGIRTAYSSYQGYPIQPQYQSTT